MVLLPLPITVTLLGLIPGIHSQSSSNSSQSLSGSYSALPTLEAFSPSKTGAFYVNSSFGYPPQNMELRVDLGQPYLWVINGNDFETCQEAAQVSSSISAHSISSSDPSIPSAYGLPCINNGFYRIEDSNSSYDYNFWQNEVFLNGVIVNGSLVQDDMSVENVIIGNNSNQTLNFEGVNFINANNTNVQLGALGLAGPIQNELTDNNIYFLEMLKNEGLIEQASYSYYPKDDTNLELVLGGCNPDHFVNDLVKFSKIPYSDGENVFYNYPIVPLTSMNVQNSNGGSVLLFDQTEALPVLLDSRSLYTVLPLSAIINLAIQLNAYYSEDDHSWLVKCSVGDLNAVIGFQFGNLTVNVPVSSMFRDSSVFFDDGEKACILGVSPLSSLGYSILGVNVLRSLYLAVNNDSNEIALAQANNQLWQSMQNTGSVTSSSASASSTQFPTQAHLIQSNTIPFAVSNNITNSFTFSVISDYSASTRIPPDVSARITSGTVYTGRFGNSTTLSSESSSSKGAANQLSPLAWDSITQYGVLGSLGLFILGFIL